VSSISITLVQGFRRNIPEKDRKVRPGNPVHYLGFPLFLINVIMFIIRVLKLLSMHEKYFFLALVVFMAVSSPAAGSLTKIAAGAPVYIGEQNLDISSGLQACHVIGWWPAGGDLTAPPSKTVTVIPTVEDFGNAFSYTINPDIFSGYPGTWYCVDKKPIRAVFELREPQLVIHVWDLDSNKDITGKTVPLTANITYRIETNLDAALQYANRPGMTPADSFFSVNLTDPRGQALYSVYSGSYGKSDTQILSFEDHPFISSSPFDWKDGNKWNRLSRNAQGEYIYPTGTYTFTVTQNLNRMQEIYAGSSLEGQDGHLDSTAAVTFSPAEPAPVQTLTVTPEGSRVPTTGSLYVTMPPLTSSTPVLTATADTPVRTTYSPEPLWVAAAGLAIASVVVPRLKG
jgi:hypothetical protein